jgi:hypothetical protein
VNKGAKRFKKLLALPSNDERVRALLELPTRKLRRLAKRECLQEFDAAEADDAASLRHLIGTAALVRFCGKGRGR